MILFGVSGPRQGPDCALVAKYPIRIPAMRLTTANSDIKAIFLILFFGGFVRAILMGMAGAQRECRSVYLIGTQIIVNGIVVANSFGSFIVTSCVRNSRPSSNEQITCTQMFSTLQAFPKRNTLACIFSISFDKNSRGRWLFFLHAVLCCIFKD